MYCERKSEMGVGGASITLKDKYPLNMFWAVLR